MDFFDAAYRGTPLWEIGRPQREFATLEERGEIPGSVLDIGCGTGEHALFFAAHGHEAWGIDSSPLAIGKAREKAEKRGLAVQFLLRNALDIAGLGRTFDTAIDSGLFHTLSDADRPVFVRGLRAVLVPGGKYFMLCFSDREPPGYGPRRISQDEIRGCFGQGWLINYIRPAVFESTTRAEGPKAWLSSITRKG